MLLIAILVAVLFLAFANGASDNFKGVATLFGSGTARYRTALGLGYRHHARGSLLAAVLAAGLVDTFKERARARRGDR